MKGWKLQRPAGPNGYWEILDEEGNSIATIYGDGPEVEANAKIIAAAKDMVEALKEHQEGIDHFYSKINFKQSFLDAKAIRFMNETNIKIGNSLKKATA